MAPPIIEPTDEALGAHLAAGMRALCDAPQRLSEGIWYTSDYRVQLFVAGRAAEGPITRWDDDLFLGYAYPPLWQRVDFCDWRLRPAACASKALSRWLAGPTLAECSSTVIALELDAVRAALGGERFDERFARTLRVRPTFRETPLEGLLVPTPGSRAGAAGTLGARPVALGDFCYFRAHPAYEHRHPGGDWKGVNVVCTDATPSRQTWAALGVPVCDEGALLDRLVEEYNTPRDEDDELVLTRLRETGGLEPAHDLDAGLIPRTITREDLCARDGGYGARLASRLDAEAVRALR